MKIAASTTQLTAERSYREEHVRRESLTLWRDAGQGNGNEELRPAAPPGQANQSEQPRLSARARALQPTKAAAPKGQEMDAMHGLKLGVLKQLVERLTGREFKLFDPAALDREGAEVELTAPAETPAADPGEGWGLVYDYYESHYESEAVQFNAQGVVRTADGQEVAFSVELSMSREFMSRESVSIRAGDALKDPLVVNFDGRAAELTDTRFAFDLDVDGREDQIAFVKPGSGFLALDRDGDGKVGDGSELFGPTSGDGFAELAAYDEDGNQWIDENDAVYAGLRIWSKDSEGNDRLMGLGQAGVGAIYLGHLETPFRLTDADNQLLGAVRSAGLYLGEDGGAGTVQQLDLVV